MHDPLTYRQEVYRKLIHISSSIIPILLWYFGKELFLPWIIGCAILFPILDYGRRYNKFLFKLYTNIFISFTRPIESKMLSGASWVFIGSAATIFIFDTHTTIAALLVLSISDSISAIIGIKYGKTIIFSKSLEGSISFFLSATFIIFILSPAPFLIKYLAVITATVVELFSTPRINDNLMIPIATAFILTIGGAG